MVEGDPLDQLPPGMRKGCRNYYDLFGVDTNASSQEIQSAYREMVKEYHPDNSDHEYAEDISYVINEAKEVLLDENERLMYNELGHTRYHRQGQVSDPLGEMHSDSNEDNYESNIYDLIRMADLSRASSEPWWKSALKSKGLKISAFIILILALLILLLLSY